MIELVYILTRGGLFQIWAQQTEPNDKKCN